MSANVGLILRAAKYLDYVAAAEARGEEPLGASDYYHFQNSSKPQVDPDSSNSSCDSRILQDPSTSSSSDGKYSFKSGEGLGHREAHNKLEKDRRKELKKYMKALSDVLPGMTEKVSSLCILRKAESFVEHLKKQYPKLCKEHRELKMEHRRLREKVKKLKREAARGRSSPLNPVNCYSDGESTATASECGDDSCDESLMDQIREVKVSRSEIMDYVAGASRQSPPVPSFDEKGAADRLHGNYEQGSILHARLSEPAASYCKDVCHETSAFKEDNALLREFPGKNPPLLDMNSRINSELNCEKPPLQVQKEHAAFQKAEFWPKESPRGDTALLDMSSRINSQLNSGEKSKFQFKLKHETVKNGVSFSQHSGEKEMLTSNGLCEQSRLTDTIGNHAGETSVHDDKLNLENTDSVCVHSGEGLSSTSKSTESLNALNTFEKQETVIKPPTTRTIKLLCAPLETPAVIRNGGESLLKSIPIPPQVHVAFRSPVVASCTSNYAPRPIKSSDGKSLSLVSQVNRNGSTIPVYVVSSSVPGTGLQLANPTMRETCSPATKLVPASALVNAKQGHCPPALPNLVALQHYTKFQ